MSGGFKALLRGESNYDFIAKTRIFASVSGVVIALSLIGLFGPKLNLSQEFTGGTSMTVSLETDTTVAALEAALADFDLEEVKVQIRTDRFGNDEAFVRTEHIEERADLVDVQRALAEAAGHGRDPDTVSVDDVGPSWGRQVSSKALRGLIAFLIAVTLYISWRFEPKMAIAALAALAHDLLATAGIYALVGFQVSPATVIALLTLMGFSLYDTVVVFDRIRENAPSVLSGGRMTYTDMANKSLNEVLLRSINTSLSSVVPVAGLLFVGVFLFGAVTLKDLALAMFIGTLVSTYSSIFVATPVLVKLKEREQRYRALRTRLGREERGPVSPVDEAPALEAEAEAEMGAVVVEDRPRPVRAPVPRGTPKPRKRKRGKRR